MQTGLIDSRGADTPSSPAETLVGTVVSRSRSTRERVIRPFDPVQAPCSASRERLHGLEFVAQRFARQFGVGLFRLIRRNVDVTVTAVSHQSYKAFSDAHDEAAHLTVLGMAPLRGAALAVLPSSVIFRLIDLLYGGTGAYSPRYDGRVFMPTEQRLIGHLVDLVMAAWREAWAPVYPLEIELRRTEQHVKFANITGSAADPVVVTALRCETCGFAGDVHLVLPFQSLEPIRAILASPGTTEAGTHAGQLGGRLADEIPNTSVTLTAELVTIASTIGEVMALRAGDVLPIGVLPAHLPVAVDGVPVMECDFGGLDGVRALRVRRLFDHSAESFASEARR